MCSRLHDGGKSQQGLSFSCLLNCGLKLLKSPPWLSVTTAPTDEFSVTAILSPAHSELEGGEEEPAGGALDH